MTIWRSIREYAVLWIGLIGFILVVGALRGLSRGLDALNDFGPLLMGAIFVGAMVLILMALFKIGALIGRLFRRA